MRPRAMPRILLSVLGPAFLALGGCQAAPVEQEKSYVRTKDGALLYYQRIVRGPDVLLVPGASFLDMDIERLGEGRTIVFYDPRGRGRSGKAGTARMERDLGDIEELCEWLHLERFAMLGWDYPAALAALYAARHPERVEKLVLVSPIPPRKTPYWDIYERVRADRQDVQDLERLRELERQGARRSSPEAWAKAYKDTVLAPMVMNKSSLQRMKSNPLVEPNTDPLPLMRQYYGLLGALKEWDWRAELAGVRCPTIVLYGVADPVPAAAFQEWAASVQGARTVEIARSGALPWIENPAPFFSAVEGFLADAGEEP